ncbi:MAG: hypothetical protein Q9187_001442 [Circinaria calcarea]
MFFPMHWLLALSFPSAILARPPSTGPMGRSANPPPGPYCPPQAATPKIQQAIFNDFVQKLFVEKNAVDAVTNYVADDLIQHNPSLADGAPAFLAGLVGSPSYNTSTLAIYHQLFMAGVGNVHTRVTSPTTTELAVSDYYRMDGTCIVEHWDVIQALPVNSSNPHPLF